MNLLTGSFRTLALFSSITGLGLKFSFVYSSLARVIHSFRGKLYAIIHDPFTQALMTVMSSQLLML